MNGWVPGGPSTPSQSDSVGSFISTAAESIRTPSAPRSNQNRRMSSNSSRTLGLDQLKSGCSGANRCRYHSPGVPSSATVRVHAGPPKIDCQSFGGSSPPGPRPGRNQNSSRTASPGSAASASRNHGCASEQWFGTRSMTSRSPAACASAMSSSASARVPNTGSMSR